MKDTFLLRFIAALNTLNQPWVAILVITLGMVFDVISQKFNISNDAATGVIGAGVGLLTGQAINGANRRLTDPEHPPAPAPAPPVPANPIPPVDPAPKQGA